MSEEEVGVVTHYFGHIPAAAIHLSKPIKVGDMIHIKGHTTDIQLKVVSMQIEHKDVQEAKSGADIGIRIADKCREHDKVFRLSP